MELSVERFLCSELALRENSARRTSFKEFALGKQRYIARARVMVSLGHVDLSRLKTHRSVLS